MIPRLKPCLDRGELSAMVAPHRDAVERFENAFAAKFGMRHAIAFPYGRSALYALLKALRIEGKEIILPAYTCSVVAHAIVLSGNIPRFVDITLDDYNMDLDQVETAIGEHTGAILATHLFGYPLDVDRLRNIVRAAEGRFGRRIIVVQDCAHAFSARWQGRRVCNAGDVALFGFNVSKMMTSIFGGMLTTDDDALAASLRSFRGEQFREPGAIKALARRLYLLAIYAAFSRPLYGVVYWLQMRSTLLDRFTKAYHLDDEIRLPPDHLDTMLPVEAEVGITQLAKYDEIEERRRKAAQRYDALLRGQVGWVLPPLKEGATYSHYVVRTQNRQAVMRALAADGIEVGQLIEYSMPEMAGYRCYADGQPFPLSLECSRSMINLPIYASLREADQRKIARSLIAASRSVQ